MRICNNCGEKISDSNTFCPYCGKKVEVENDSNEEVSE